MTGEAITDEELAELVRRTEVATSASMRGDMDRYLAMTRHGRGYTPREPLERAALRYEDRALEQAAALARGGTGAVVT